MDRTLTRGTVLAAVLAGAAPGCSASAEVERLYLGGWIFLGLIVIALLALVGMIIRYLAAGRRETTASPSAEKLPRPKDSGDPNDWV